MNKSVTTNESPMFSLQELEFEMCSFLQTTLQSNNTNVALGILGHYRELLDEDVFQSRLTESMLVACRLGQVKFVKHCLTTYLRHLDLNSLFSYDFIYNDDEECLCFDKDFIPDCVKTNTLLHFAAESGDVEMVKFLLKFGANVTVVNCCGQTPLWLGLSNKNVVQTLLDNGLNVNEQDKLGSTPLIQAVRYHTHDTVKCLLEAKADPFIKDKYGCTALDYCVNAQDAKSWEVLFMSGHFPTCDSSGRLIGLSHFFKSSLLTRKIFQYLNQHTSIAKNVKLSLKLLDACIHFHHSHLFLDKFHDAICYKQEHNIPIIYPESLAVYSNRKEIQSCQELKDLLEQSEYTRNTEIMWQVVLILERVTGYASVFTLKYYHQLMIRSLQSSHLLMKDESLLIYEHFSEKLLYYMNNMYPDTMVSGLIRDSFPPLSVTLEMKPTQSKMLKIVSILSNLAQCVQLYLQYLSNIHEHSQLKVYAKRKGEFQIILNSTLTLMESLISIDFPGSNEIALMFLDACQAQTLSFDGKLTTVLHEALRFCSTPFIAWLLDSGADKWINISGPLGNYPLHVAVLNGRCNTKLIQLLLDNGAHVDAVDSRGKTVVELIGHIDPKTKAVITEQFYPLPLFCITAVAVTTYKLPYQDLDLPKHIKRFIGLHDFH